MWVGIQAKAQVTVGDDLLTGVVKAYIADYKTEDWGLERKFTLEKITQDSAQTTLGIYFNDTFAQQPFTREKVERIYKDVKRILPSAYAHREVTIYSQYTPIELLVGGQMNDSQNDNAPLTWGEKEYTGSPWVKNTSMPEETRQRALNGRHFVVWQSHGRYFDTKSGGWLWQRPQLYCTTEDLLTQTFVNPLLVPMLENAGAYVYMPRERDWQPLEAIVDNDKSAQLKGVYKEANGTFKWHTDSVGFAARKAVYTGRENPFSEGTTRSVEADSVGIRLARAVWTPTIEKTGDYAVYVSYRTLENSIDDAHYTVVHQGISTQFSVNQRMGGGTWVYLGTFTFSADDTKNNYVQLTNQSAHSGLVTADAVRFGGGMGNIARSTGSGKATTSGLPRYLEGSRYNLQWSGAPDSVYSHFEGNDYTDDYSSRPYMVNHLAGGSIYLPEDTGMCVPVEMSLAIHSDAGVTKDETKIGTLTIYSGDKYGERLFPSGISRLTTRTLCENMMQTICHDIEKTYGNWNRREIYNKSYAETRTPVVPAVIVEMFSHQNFADMKLAHDPNFKFTMARAMYKSVARYNAYMHGADNVVIQPLPVSKFAATANAEKQIITLTWEPTKDNLESTAKPKGYIIYMATDDKGWDNGTYVRGTQYKLRSTSPQHLYRFKVCAYNEGGISLPSEELCARCGVKGSEEVVIVNGFQRVAAPQSFETKTTCGFNMQHDPGVAYLRTPEYCGPQTGFNKANIGKETAGGLGYSSAKYVGRMMAGNTFDYPTLHARIMMQTEGFIYSISSCSRAALEDGKVNIKNAKLVDVIMGAQKADGYSPVQYPVFTSDMRHALKKYASHGGNILVSGAYIGTDIQSKDEEEFMKDILHCAPDTIVKADSIMLVCGSMYATYEINTTPNEEVYSIRYASSLTPLDGATCSLHYDSEFRDAAVTYKGKGNVTTVGFPLELIADEEQRIEVIRELITKTLNQ